MSVAGLFAFFGLLVGYLIAASFFIAALVKPFAPHRVGLWWQASGELSLHLGFVAAPPTQGEELLGWWIMPLGLLAGGVGFWFATWFGRWCIRRFRKTTLVPTR